MTKTIFIEAKSKQILDASQIESQLKDIPKQIALCYSIQFKAQAEEIKQILEKNNAKIVSFIQVLGCSQPQFPKETKTILLIGQGRFHATALQYETNIPTFILQSNKITKITDEDVKTLEKNHKASYLKYLTAKDMGILVTTKPGQQRLKQALEFKNKINKDKSENEKKAYMFIANDLNEKEFENFQVDSWVNTACSRMDLVTSDIINLSRLNKLQN